MENEKERPKEDVQAEPKATEPEAIEPEDTKPEAAETEDAEPEASEAVEESKGEKKKKKLSPDKEKLQKLQEEFEAHKQQHLRVLAEYDNFRKRTQNEKSLIYNNAVSDTIQAILPIADNIQLALSQENASAEDMRKGVEMIESQIETALEKLGVKPIGEVGEAFDPNLHNAVAHIDDDSLGENVIAVVYQKGYLLGDRVVRHAMVQVAN